MRSIFKLKQLSMGIYRVVSLGVACFAYSSQILAAPTVISTMTGTATAYAFFTVDTGKLNGRTVSAVQAELQQQLDTNGTGLTACWVTGDLNVTNLSCGNGAMRFGPSEMYTYNLETGIAGVPFAFDKAIGEAQGANFISPNGVIPGDEFGRVVRIHFKQRVAQFGMLIDSGLAPSITGVQFIVNNQPTTIKPLQAGVVEFVGVEDKAGFNDVTIIPSGSNRGYIVDHFSYVLLANFGG